MNNFQEVRDWAATVFGGVENGEDAARYLASAVLEADRPSWGDVEAWSHQVARKELWLLAHARWRLDEQAVRGIQVWLHGRGVRVHSPERNLDVFVHDIYEFDRVLHEEVTK